MSDTLSICWEDRIAGSLRLNSYGEMQFAYVSDWPEDSEAPALSFSLPKRYGAPLRGPTIGRSASR
jgi:serine/threonine-protein kinase HipA